MLKINNKQRLINTLNKKRDVFYNSFIDNFSSEYINNFVKKNNLIHEELENQETKYFCLGFLTFLLGIFTTFILAYSGMGRLDVSVLIFVFSLSITGILCNYSYFFEPETKIINEWVLEEKNIMKIKEKIFEDTAIDKEVMEFFINTYSKKELVDLLMQKESLTYKDIYRYINNEENRKIVNKKENNLLEAIDCLEEKIA